MPISRSFLQDAFGTIGSRQDLNRESWAQISTQPIPLRAAERRLGEEEGNEEQEIVSGSAAPQARFGTPGTIASAIGNAFRPSEEDSKVSAALAPQPGNEAGLDFGGEGTSVFWNRWGLRAHQSSGAVLALPSRRFLPRLALVLLVAVMRWGIGSQPFGECPSHKTAVSSNADSSNPQAALLPISLPSTSC